jgi:hypothetical protein
VAVAGGGSTMIAAVTVSDALMAILGASASGRLGAQLVSPHADRGAILLRPTAAASHLGSAPPEGLAVTVRLPLRRSLPKDLAHGCGKIASMRGPVEVQN